MVEFAYDLNQFSVSDKCKITIFRNVLPDQAMHIFISTTLSDGLRLSKEEINIEFISDPFFFSKLLTIVSCDSMQTIRSRLEQVNHRIAYQVGFASFDLTQ